MKWIRNILISLVMLFGLSSCNTIGYTDELIYYPYVHHSTFYYYNRPPAPRPLPPGYRPAPPPKQNNHRTPKR